jgi:transposase
MTPIEIRNAVLTLQQQGTGLRETAKLLGLSRNTVRRILREPAVRAARVGALDEAMQQRLAQVYARAGGNAVRMGQILAEEHDQQLPYSTLTRWVRQTELREPPKRSGEYHFEPGQEMQHDTSPHRVEVAGKPIKAQCAGLTLAYSRRLLVQYYPTFTRFEAKHFLLHAAQFMDGTAARCVIDNTSVVLAGGSGADAVIAPEMAAFAHSLGFKFLAHRLNDPDRKELAAYCTSSVRCG